MPDVLIRDLTTDTIDSLKAQAERNGRSLQAELKRIIESATPMAPDQVRAMFAEWHKRLGTSAAGDAAADIRADRER